MWNRASDPRGIAIVLWLTCSTSGATQEEPWLRDDVTRALESIQVEDVKATVYYLASDAMKGRDTPSPELDIAADYIAARFQALGLEPWRQSIELDGVVQPPTVEATFTLKGQDWAAESPGAVAAIAGGRPKAITLQPSELLFVGATTNLFAMSEHEPRSKALIVVAHSEPAAEPDPRMPAIGPAEMSFFGARMGARSVLYVTPPGPEGDAYYEELLKDAAVPSLGGMRGAQAPVIALRGSAFLDALAAALDVQPGDFYDSVVEPQPVDGSFATTILAQRTAPLTADNVGALLPGSDPDLTHETVIVSAHYDHIGERPGSGEDTICNGADDDATGTTAVIEIASAFAQLETPPRRSILFLAFCGEEKGFLGSRHYVDHPRVPLDDTVAMINIEMIGRPDDIEPRSAWMTGYSLSDVGPLMTEATENLEFHVYEHDTLSERLFAASDNLPLARKGVPAHSISAGSLHPDYHQPSDEADRLDHGNMTEVIRAIFVGALWIAERDDRPEWDVQNPRAEPFAEGRSR